MTDPDPVNEIEKPTKTRKAAPKRQRGNRTGFTTGACSAAAARAAAEGLLSGVVPATVSCLLPNGQRVSFSIHAAQTEDQHSWAEAVVIKDAGDDPDVTHGAHIRARVERLPMSAPGTLELHGGEGVGVVTREGLGLEVGGPAINPVPRANIAANVREVAAAYLEHAGLAVTISVAGGEAMAAKTLNPRLGIMGGISILGTTGIVRPYSTAAFRASVVQAVEVAARQHSPAVVFTTGGRTEKTAMQAFSELPEAAFVQMGDFVKAAFQTAVRQGFGDIRVGAMAGKLTKMAQGLPVTHAWRETIDRDLLARTAADVGAPEEVVEAIRGAETARFAAEKLTALGLAIPFYRRLARAARASLKSGYPGSWRLTILVVDFDGAPLTLLKDEDEN